MNAISTITVQNPVAMVSDGQLVWVLAPGLISRVDPSIDAVTGAATLGPVTDLYNALAVNAAGLWATNWDAALLYRVDPSALDVAASIPAGLAPKGVLASADGVWVADTHGGTVLRTDPNTNTVVATTPVGQSGPGGPSWLAEGVGSIWVDLPNNGTIVRLDPTTATVQTTIHVPLGFVPCGGMVIADNAAWVTSCADGNLLGRVDATTNTLVATIDMNGLGFNPTLINGSVWISVDGGDETSGSLVRIDPQTNTIDRVVVPSTSFGGGGDIGVAAGSVWVTDGYHNALLRLPLSAFAP